MKNARKYLSGSDKRKKKQRIEQLTKSQAGSIQKFFPSNRQGETRENSNESLVSKEGEDIVPGELDGIINIEREEGLNDETEVVVNVEHEEGTDAEIEEEVDAEIEFECDDCSNEETDQAMNENREYGPINLFDPGNWNNVDKKYRDLLIEKGPIRHNAIGFPRNDEGRHFSTMHYVRHIGNGLKQDRE